MPDTAFPLARLEALINLDGSGQDHESPERACEVVHRALELLPALQAPGEARVADGLYFFYEEGETSRHAPGGRVVRVGNHPRSDGTLARRLSQHYSGHKNGSVFRKALGGALLRQSDPLHPCLEPDSGAGHWERQGADPCERCLPIEAAVSRLIRQRFRFRVVAVADRRLRNEMEARLIATLAACPICRPSSSWLGRSAYSPSMRRSGLWNTEFVGGPTLSQDRLAEFEQLAVETARVERAPAAAAPRRVPKPSARAPGGTEPERTLIVIPCSSGKERGSDAQRQGPTILEHLPAELAERLREARDRLRTVAAVDDTRMPAWRRYGRGLLYQEADPSLGKAIEKWPHIVILSGAYGVVTAREPIGHYGRQMSLGDWPDSLLHEVLAAYSAAHGIERVVAFAARSGDYRVLLRETAWPECVRAVAIHLPAHLPGVEAREATPRVMGAALAAFLDQGADLATWRDARFGSRLDVESPIGRRSPAPLERSSGRISDAALAEVRDALERYRVEVEAASIADNTKRTYLLHSEDFVRWLGDRFTPGGGKGA